MYLPATMTPDIETALGVHLKILANSLTALEKLTKMLSQPRDTELGNGPREATVYPPAYPLR